MRLAKADMSADTSSVVAQVADGGGGGWRWLATSDVIQVLAAQLHSCHCINNHTLNHHDRTPQPTQHFVSRPLPRPPARPAAHPSTAAAA